MKRIAALLAIGIFWASPAHPDRFVVRWLPAVTDQGCVVYWQWVKDAEEFAEDTNFTWSGTPCESGKPLNGKGTLTFRLVAGDMRDDNYSNALTGRMVDGVMDGPVHAKASRRGQVVASDEPYFMGCSESDLQSGPPCVPRERVGHAAVAQPTAARPAPASAQSQSPARYFASFDIQASQVLCNPSGCPLPWIKAHITSDYPGNHGYGAGGDVNHPMNVGDPMPAGTTVSYEILEHSPDYDCAPTSGSGQVQGDPRAENAAGFEHLGVIRCEPTAEALEAHKQ